MSVYLSERNFQINRLRARPPAKETGINCLTVTDKGGDGVCCTAAEKNADAIPPQARALFIPLGVERGNSYIQSERKETYPPMPTLPWGVGEAPHVGAGGFRPQAPMSSVKALQ